MEGGNPCDRLHRVDVRRDGEADLPGNGRLAQTADCAVGESSTVSNARKVEGVRFGTDDPPGRPRMSETVIRTLFR